MSSYWSRSISRSNIHEYQDPEMNDFPKMDITSKARFFSWQHLTDAPVGVGDQPSKEYFRVEERRPDFWTKLQNSLEFKDLKPLRPLTPAIPLEACDSNVSTWSGAEQSPSQTNAISSSKDNLPEKTSTFEDMQKRRKKWVYKYNI